MLAREIMSADPVCATPNDSVQKIARLMRDQHFGCVPVVRSDHDRLLVGLVTDRDLALRVISEAKPADTPVEDVMSTGLSCCLPGARIEDVEDIMTRRHSRRVFAPPWRGRHR